MTANKTNNCSFSYSALIRISQFLNEEVLQALLHFLGGQRHADSPKKAEF